MISPFRLNDLSSIHRNFSFFHKKSSMSLRNPPFCFDATHLFSAEKFKNEGTRKFSNFTNAGTVHSFDRRKTYILFQTVFPSVRRTTNLGSRPITREYSNISYRTFENAKSAFVNLNEASDMLKAEMILKHALKNCLNVFEIDSNNLTLSEDWTLLQRHLLTYFNYAVAPYDRDNIIKNLYIILKLFNLPLVKGTQVLSEPQWHDYLYNATEVFWGFNDVGLPFVRKSNELSGDIPSIRSMQRNVSDDSNKSEGLLSINQKVLKYSQINDAKDASAAIHLTAPLLDDSTLLYEMGCWNGQNLLNLLFYAQLNGKLPKYCLATDINPKALKMAECVASFLSINEPFIRFYLANAQYPLDCHSLGLSFSKEIRLALRLLPVLSPSDGKALIIHVRNSFKRKDDSFILSYATQKGEMYEKNLSRATDYLHRPQVAKEPFSYGISFWQEVPEDEKVFSFLPKLHASRYLMNTYYTEEGFNRLIKDCNFQIKNMIKVQDSDNERITVELSPL